MHRSIEIKNDLIFKNAAVSLIFKLFKGVLKKVTSIEKKKRVKTKKVVSRKNLNTHFGERERNT